MTIEKKPKSTYRKDYQPPSYWIDTVALTVVLGKQEARIQSRLELRKNLEVESDTGRLRLDGEGLTPISFQIDGRSLDPQEYCIDSEGVTLYRVPERFELASEVAIQPQHNTTLEGLFQSGGIVCTQCEAEGFRKITWYLDRPDVMARFTTTIIANKSDYPVLLSNGNLLETYDLKDGMHCAKWEDPFPKPAYLFALVAGDLNYIQDSFQTASGRVVDLRIYVEPEHIDRCEHALRSLKNAMAWDEAEYGREYDLDIYMIVAVNDFNMGAMENKGLNLFNSRFVLASPESATDQDYQSIEAVIAHEYFHNWTGNRVTCRDWFQLSLKEGLTVFRDQEFSADRGSRHVKRIQDVRLLRTHQFTEDAGPMAHPVRPDSYMEINNFYTVTVYEKGAELVRMLKRLLGARVFRRGCDLYFERHDGQAVTTDDFIQCMADVSGRDLGQFANWYAQAGTPKIQVSGSFYVAEKRYVITLVQSCPPTPGQAEKEPFHIPFVIGLMDGEGNELALKQPSGSKRCKGVLELRYTKEEFVFTDIDSLPVPSLLRGFSAPVKVDYDYDDEALFLLMAHDSDGFNRWDAAQTLCQRILFRQLKTGTSAIPKRFFEAYRLAFLALKAKDPALLSQMLDLPSESYLAGQMKPIDVEGIHRVREEMTLALAKALYDEFESFYQENHESGVHQITPAAMARRSLKNRCLNYLMYSGNDQAERLCIHQYHNGQNMTDTLAALTLIADSDMPQRRQVLDHFYQKWKGDALVLDKWFMVQARSRREDTLTRVKRLMQDESFSIRNPNRVRALIGVFCNHNPRRFHASDGSGYRFLSQCVLELDRLNPQVAARMVQAMVRWRDHGEPRRELMREQFQHILAQQEVSRDLSEIAIKSLE